MNRWLRTIRISRKLQLISVTYTILFIVVVMYLLTKGINTNIRFGSLEMAGNAYQRPLEKLMEKIPRHQALVHRYLLGGRKKRKR